MTQDQLVGTLLILLCCACYPLLGAKHIAERAVRLRTWWDRRAGHHTDRAAEVEVIEDVVRRVVADLVLRGELPDDTYLPVIHLGDERYDAVVELIPVGDLDRLPTTDEPEGQSA